MADIEGIKIERLGHDAFLIEHGETKIYIDPFKVEEGKADLILITHEHFDHCDKSSVNKLRKPDTVVIAPFGCMVKLDNFKQVSAGDVLNEKGVKVEAVPAYNIGKPYHPRGIGVGYVLTINGKRIYHAGDTDKIEDMKRLRGVDIAMLPVSGTYVMTAEEAAHAAEEINPKVAIPMHYGSIIGTDADAEKFRSLCRCRVELL